MSVSSLDLRYVNMGKELYRTEPVFRAAVDQCAKLCEGLLPKPLLEVMHSDSDDGLLNQQGSPGLWDGNHHEEIFRFT